MTRPGTSTIRASVGLVLALVVPLGCKAPPEQSTEIRASAAVGTATFTEFAPPSGAQPFAITAGPDGNLWFTEFNKTTKQIGKITTAGTITEYAVPTVSGRPYRITPGPDGNLWFTEDMGNKIGKITPSGAVTEYAVPTTNSSPYGIVKGGDGALWFTEGRLGGIGRITTSGTIKEYPALNGNPISQGIAAATDGSLWDVEPGRNSIGHISTAGAVTEFKLPTASAWPGDIALGSDGNLWFTESSKGKIGRITPAGVITEFLSPTGQVNQDGIARGPDGNIWFADLGRMFSITPAGLITQYQLPASIGVSGIAAGPDGNLWYTNGQKVVRMIVVDPLTKVSPIASCIIPNTGTSSFTAIFGYKNTGTDNYEIAPGTAANTVAGAQPDQGPPRWFAPGTTGTAVVIKKATGTVSWTLGKTTAQLTSSSSTCTQVSTAEGTAIVVGGVQYPYLTDVGKVAADKVVVGGTDGLGTAPGDLTVTPDGASSYSIPLWVPAGRLVQPSLSLSYNSRQGNGLVGVGWSLSGLSRITRCTKTLRNSTGARPVQLDQNDLYCLDGNPLVLVSGTYGAQAEYRTQDNIGAKITSLADVATTAAPGQMGPERFVVYGKSGRISTYQRTDVLGLPLTRNGQPANYAWLLSRVEDRFHNAMTIAYRPREAGIDPATLEILPDKILYTSNSATGDSAKRSVEFKYGLAASPDQPASRRDPIDQYVAGIHLLTGKRLTEIRMFGPNPVTQGMLRQYILQYAEQLGHASTTGRSLLETVTECSATACRPSTTFTWEKGDLDFEAGVAVSGIPDVQYGFNLVDADNDGRNDLVYRVNEDGLHGHWKYRPRLPNGTFGAPVNLFDYPRKNKDTATTQPSWDNFDEPDLAVMDLDGDGLAEGIRRNNVTDTSFTTTYRTIAGTATGATAVQMNDPHVPFAYGDVNGDGLPDIFSVQHYQHRDPNLNDEFVPEIAWRARLGQRDLAAMFSADPRLLFSTEFSNPRDPFLARDGVGVVVDTNGDGIQELLLGTDGTTSWKVVTFTGSLPSPIFYENSNDLRADLNGDGLRDLISFSPTPPELVIRVNVGGDFKEKARVPSGAGSLLQVYPTNRNSPSTNAQDLGVRIADFDGDGRQDLVIVGRNDWSSDTRDKVLVLRSTPTGLELYQPLANGVGIPMGHFYRSCVTPTSGQCRVHGMRGSQLADFDGDGLEDLIQLEGTQPGQLTMMVYKRKGKRPDVITSINSGLGRSTDVAYAHIGQPGAPYTTANNCGLAAGVFQRCMRSGLWVVSSVSRDRGLPGGEQTTTLHSYQDAVRDLVPGGRGAFFRTHTVTNADTLEQTITNYGVGSPTDVGADVFGYVLAGRPIDSTRTIPGPGGANTSERRVFHQTVRRRGSFYRVENVETDEFFRDGKSALPVGQWDRQTTTKDTFSDDEFANVTLHEELTWGSRPATLLKSVSEQTTDFVNNAATWIVGRAKDLTTSIKSSSLDMPIVRKRTFAIDTSDGRLLSETTMAGAGADFELTRTFTYSSLGRVRSVTATAAGPAGPDSRTTTTDYDESESIFVRRSTNALGHTSESIYHPGLGVLVWAKDVAGAVTRSSYESFGRPRSTQPDGAGAVSTDYFPSLAPGRAAYRVETAVTGGGRTVIHYDRLGRQVSSSVFNTQGNWTTVNSTYDKRGRLATESLVTEEFNPGTGQLTAAGMMLPKGQTSYSYDERGRPTLVTTPDGLSISTSYGDRVRTLTDRRGNKTYTLFDDLGRAVESGLGDGVARRANPITFAYGQNASGAFSSITDSQGHTMVNQADAAGRSIQSTDPDRGQESAHYNAFGEVRDQSVPGTSIPIVFIRDGAGRVFNRTDSDGTTTFVWDSAPNGLGQLARSISPDGTTVSETYDRLGRAVNDTYTINGETFTVSRTLDPNLGRLTRLAYPDVPNPSGSPVTTAVKYDYNARTGQLNSLSDDGSRLYYQVDSRDLNGRRTAEHFGNSVNSSSTFNPVTGRLEHLASKTAALVTVAEFQYGYDNNGNLTSRENQTDPAQKRLETFTYDEQDRLSTWNRSGVGLGWQVTYDIDASGNLTGRTVRQATGGTAEQVTYTYNPTDPVRPHAVRSMKTLPLASSSDGSFGYDARGNQISRPGISGISYTMFGLPRILTKGSVTTSFRYDAGGTRVWKGRNLGDISESSTTYVGGLYERRKSPSTGVTHVFYVTAGPKVVAQVVRTGANPTTATNTYLHGDPLGSVTATTNQAAGVLSRLSYDPFGNRYDPVALPLLSTSLASSGTDVTRNFTGHEMDDDLGLVNMRGRMYDARSARFLSPDPVVAVPSNAQSYNRYAYVRNNPLVYIDPSGYFTENSQCQMVEGSNFHQECNTHVALPPEGRFGAPEDWDNSTAAEDARRRQQAANDRDNRDEELADDDDGADAADEAESEEEASLTCGNSAGACTSETTTEVDSCSPDTACSEMENEDAARTEAAAVSAYDEYVAAHPPAAPPEKHLRLQLGVGASGGIAGAFMGADVRVTDPFLPRSGALVAQLTLRTPGSDNASLGKVYMGEDPTTGIKFIPFGTVPDGPVNYTLSPSGFTPSVNLGLPSTTPSAGVMMKATVTFDAILKFLADGAEFLWAAKHSDFPVSP
jgi:RHS repeat-associated protein